MVAMFVNSSLAGKDIPGFYELFSGFEKSQEEIELEDKKRIDYLKAQMLIFAERHNAQRKGD